MRLVGARVARNACETERIDVSVRDGRVAGFGPAARGRELEIDLSGYLLLPGLINAHDHLEFNLFPRLGRGPYGNALEWARDVYHPDASPVKEQLAAPKRIRLLWGGLKNLLSGVTTVAHHNPYEPATFDHRFPIRVVERFAWAHSLDFSPDLAEKFRSAPADSPFVVHAAEGTDEDAFAEIERLDALGALDSRTVLVHAIALKAADIELIRARRCSIVWCPTSNLFTCGKTLPVEALNAGIPIALGTDSALTAAGDLRDEICAARKAAQMPMSRVYEMLTTAPASILRLREGHGEIREAGPADLVAIPDHGQTPAAALADLHASLVMVAGRIKLMSPGIMSQNARLHLSRLQRICVEERGEAFVDMNLAFMQEVAAGALGNFCLAGKRVSL